MAAAKIKWYKIAEHRNEIPFGKNNMALVSAAGKKVCLSLHEEQLYACAHKCPHAGGHLNNGYIDKAGNIVCPLHRYTFSLKNGRNTSGEGYYLKRWPVEEREDGIYIGMEEAGFWDLFG